MEPLKIVKLEAQNVKRLVAVEITPEGNLIILGGKNGAGKSSVLDSIMYALGGKEAVCAKPLRRGSDHGHVIVDLGDLVVRRTFTVDGGGTLTVSNKEGADYRSPQAMLDKLVGRLSFDPLEFSNMESKHQRQTLQALVGIDFGLVNAQREQLYSERTAVGRTLKTLEGHLARMPKHGDAPPEDIAVSALMERLDEIETYRKHAADLDAQVDELRANAERKGDRVAELDREIEELDRKRLKILGQRNEIAKHQAAILPELDKALDALKAATSAIPDDKPVRSLIAQAEGLNRKRRDNADHAKCAAEIEETKAEIARLTTSIEGIDRDKAAALEAAEFPVPGLSFDETGVLLNGLPFSQASSAEQLRVSVAMGLALNPALRVLLIRDGSLLDAANLALVAEMAQQADAQVWLERVSEGDEVSVVIEDGAVRGPSDKDAA